MREPAFLTEPVPAPPVRRAGRWFGGETSVGPMVPVATEDDRPSTVASGREKLHRMIDRLPDKMSPSPST